MCNKRCLTGANFRISRTNLSHSCPAEIKPLVPWISCLKIALKRNSKIGTIKGIVNEIVYFHSFSEATCFHIWVMFSFCKCSSILTRAFSEVILVKNGLGDEKLPDRSSFSCSICSILVHRYRKSLCLNEKLNRVSEISFREKQC